MAEAEVAPRKREGRPQIIAPAPGWRMDGRNRAEGWTVLEEVNGAPGGCYGALFGTCGRWVDTPPGRSGGAQGISAGLP